MQNVVEIKPGMEGNLSGHACKVENLVYTVVLSYGTYVLEMVCFYL